nr:hypothetical protein [Tanacetum cinerariifolium]
PNWAHDALLEFSSSKPQDHCSTEVPKSSGNSNPTASTSNPPADQMETLTVETSIPTVNSPISDALQDPSWVEAMQEELIQFKIQNVWTLVDCPKGTLFIKKQREDFILVQVYVDDIIFGSSHPQLCREFEALMHEKFQMSAMGELNFFFGLQVLQKEDGIFLSQDKEFEALMHEKFQMSAMGELNFFFGLQVLQKEDGIFLSQDKYVEDILKKFRYSDVRSSNTPMDKENPWGKDGTGKDVDLHLYRSMIGSLMYLTASRPDIMFAVCAYARHQVTPKECHQHAVKRIFRYLKSHPKLGLWYPKESPFDLVAYSNSDYGGATQDRKSTTVGCHFLGRRLISWQCKKHIIVATSTTEAEYVAAASCCGQVLWIQNQLLDYGDYGGATQDRKSTTVGCQFLGRRKVPVLSCKYWNA